MVIGGSIIRVGSRPAKSLCMYKYFLGFQMILKRNSLKYLGKVFFLLVDNNIKIIIIQELQILNPFKIFQFLSWLVQEAFYQLSPCFNFS